MDGTYITVFDPKEQVYYIAHFWPEDLQSQVVCTCIPYKEAIRIRDALIAAEEDQQ